MPWESQSASLCTTTRTLSSCTRPNSCTRPISHQNFYFVFVFIIVCICIFKSSIWHQQNSVLAPDLFCTSASELAYTRTLCFHQIMYFVVVSILFCICFSKSVPPPETLFLLHQTYRVTQKCLLAFLSF